MASITVDSLQVLISANNEQINRALREVSGQLGGLTGDTYGFLTECGVVIYLMLAVYLLR